MAGTSFTLKENEKKRIESLLVGSETVSQFAHKATMEKVNRMESRDERSRRDLMIRDKEALRPVFIELIAELKKEGII